MKSQLRKEFDQLSPKAARKFITIVAQLPENYQRTIRMTLSGYTQTQVAATLKVSQPRVSKMLKRGLEVVMEVLNDKDSS